MRPITLILIAFIFFSCQGQENVVTEIFSFEQAKGIWVPFEIRDADGSVQSGSFTSNSFFGVYAESFKLNEDQTFIPVVWSTNTNFLLKEDEKGTCKFFDNRLVFNGTWELDFELIKFENNELWLKRLDFLMKFKREM